MHRDVTRWIVLGGLAVVLANVGSTLRTVRAAGDAEVAAEGDHAAEHMKMTALQPAQPGDQERAEAIVTAARAFAERYTDYRKALADGYKIFAPEVPQVVYHFSNYGAARSEARHFDPSKPTSLLYEKTAASEAGGEPGWKLVGVMYTAPFQAPESELNRRVPLSVAQWHLHTNLCLPPAGMNVDWMAKDAKFGLDGSITTAQACKVAGGHFQPHLFGWMVHVYPFETDPKKVWAAGMDDDHNMDHGVMPVMKM
jgi:hypothetical protein